MRGHETHGTGCLHGRRRASELHQGRRAARAVAADLTQNIRSLEERLGVRLLQRTTRSVSMTEVGRFLIAQLRPAFESLNGAVEQLNSFRAKPAGSLRIVAVPMAATMVVRSP